MDVVVGGATLQQRNQWYYKAMDLVHLNAMLREVVQASNNETDNGTCTELQSSDDGNLPLILGINVMIALVRQVVVPVH